MSVSLNLSGQLNISLQLEHSAAGWRIATAQLHSQRLRLASQWLATKPVQQSPQLLATLFSICGLAQGAAATQACTAALGMNTSAAQADHDANAWQIEALFEHLLRLAQDWPVALGLAAVQPQALQRLFQLKRRGLSATTPTTWLPEVEAWISEYVFGMPLVLSQACLLDADVKQLSTSGLLGQLLTRLQARHWERLGQTTVRVLPVLAWQWWQARLQASDVEQFMAAPDWQAQPCETGALARQWEQPALAGWREQYGSGVVTRLLARCLELYAVVERLRHSECAAAAWSVAPQTGEGLSALETARGLLVHRVVQQAGLVEHYQIVAPTEWNFHPQGVLKQMLVGLHAKDQAELRSQVQLLLTALDPCVAVPLEMQHA